MATELGAVQWDALLKELYPSGVPEEMLARNHTFLSMVAKDTEAYGEYMVIPVVYSGPSGRSASISTLLGGSGNAFSPIGPTKSAKFNVSLVEDYGATWIDELTMMKAANDRGAFVNARKFEIDNVLTQLGESLSHALFRAGDGTIGQGDGSWTITGDTITLSRKADTKFFGIGMHLDFIANSSGAPSGAPRALASTYRVVVTSISEDAGTVTCAEDGNGAAVADISAYYTSLANTDWIAPVGDYNSSYATTGAEKVKGLAAWIPLTEPGGSDSFWGVNRSVFPTRLAGHRLDDSTAPAEDSIMTLAEIMRERGARPNVCILSPRQFTKVSKRLNAKVEYQGAGGNADYGFSSFGIATSAGILKVVTDSDCPEDRGYLLNMSTWKLKHLGGLPHLVTTDGLSMLRRSASDSVEVRARYYAQLVCTAPGQNGVFSVA